MVLLELTADPIGRFQVNDNLTITEVLFNPWVEDSEVQTIQEMLQRKTCPMTLLSDSMRATLASLYSIGNESIVWHLRQDPPLQSLDLPPEDQT